MKFMTLLYLLLMVLGLMVSLYLFHRAAGTLNIGKINVVSLTYFLFLIQTYLGISLIMLGFDKHYTLKYLTQGDGVLPTVFYVTIAAMILLPLVILGVFNIAKVKAGPAYDAYLQAPVRKEKDEVIFWLVIAGGGVCLLLLAVYLLKIGYLPLLKMIAAPADFNFALERTRINSIIVINQYVRNLLILQFIPLVSYITFAFSLSTRKMKWHVLTVVFFAAALVTKTNNFSKSPVIFHLFIYLLIFIYIRGGLKRWVQGVFWAAMAGLTMLFYTVLGAGGMPNGWLDIYNGPLGRIIFTQVGTLSYSFDMFPAIYPYLGGRSFTPTLLRLVGADPARHLRSAKVIMDFYGSERVYDGTAGVMNSCFLGEAYANFGFWGILFSIFWVGLMLAVFFLLMLKLPKTPVTVVLSAVMACKLALMSQTGFTDFVYSADVMVTTVGLLILNVAPQIWDWLLKRLHTKPRKQSAP
ncbi:oligosaccharide repeat unit polymerase [Zongyangia hominis]|uniref:Oligosaccharide repeat unit polymerase n=1 Tax=Zongyangia hominis TaxID=2763677 RepID=A0A926EAY9_9FIRM|nr:oligosaccharide repeat unit polymerase [Zongyangia hominis]MBC8570463.1 oligosaccharide repeat unit polymerase [Zongyangia hominis]